jgi:AraC-like DNA-binding protein
METRNAPRYKAVPARTEPWSCLADGPSPFDVSVTYVRLLCGVLRDYGLDPVPLLRAARIPLGVLTSPDRRIGSRQELLFEVAFASLTEDDPGIWAETGRRYRFPVFEDFGMALITAPTLRQLRDLVTTLGYSVGQYRAIDIGQRQTGIELTLPPNLDRASAFFRFLIVREIVGGVISWDDIWQAPFPLDRLELPLDAVPSELEDLVRAPVMLGCASVRWVWQSSLLDVPLPRSDAMLHKLYAGRRERSVPCSVASKQLDQQILAILGRRGNANLSLAQVAAELVMSPRTLQRRLKDQDISLRALRDETRMNEACRLLSCSDIRVSEISEQLGYVEVASFSNAFRRWTGETPSQFRLGRAQGRRLRVVADSRHG